MHLLKLILLLFLCIWMSAKAQTPYDSFAPETSRPMLTSEALSREKCAQDFSSDTTLLVAMIDRQQERILLVDMSDGSIVAYAPLTDNKSHWLSPDPLLDKYPEISPYAYCAWNPLKYVDPDGREKHIFHHEKSAGMYTSINLPDDNGIYIFAHGSKKKYIQVLNKNQHLKNENITAEELSQYIQNHSKQWEDDEKNEDISMVFLYACHTGEGESSLAEELSSKLNEHDTYVVAPMGTLISKNSPNKIKNGKYKGVRDDFNNVLPWGVFKNGELITTIRGNKSPNTKTLKNRLYINQILETLKKHFIHDDK